jgi:hypothetical protein
VVHYPFHPLHGRELEVSVCARRGESVATVFVDGTRLQIPSWMLEQWSAALEIGQCPSVDVSALLLVADLLSDLIHQTTLPSSSARDSRSRSRASGGRKRTR